MPKSIDLFLPSGGSISSLCKFSQSIAELPEQYELHIRARHVKFLRPTCMIWLAKTCQMRNRRYESEKLIYHGLNRLSYANNMGFSQALDLKDNPYPQGAFGGERYIPLSVMSKDSLEDDCAEQGGELGDAIESRCEDIAQIVSQDRSDDLRTTLSRSFCEIFRNCFEHGRSDQPVFCAQYWPNTDTVEICIAD